MSFEDFQETDDYYNLNLPQRMQAAAAYYDQKVASQVPEEHRAAGKEAFIKQKTPDLAVTAVHAADNFMGNVSNVGQELAAKYLGLESNPDFPLLPKYVGSQQAMNDYEQSNFRNKLQKANTEQEARVEQANRASGKFAGIGQGDVANFVGASVPAMIVGGPAAAGAEAGVGGFLTAAGMRKGFSGAVGKATSWLAGTEAAGAAGVAGAATNAETVDESLQQSKENLKTSGWLSPALGIGLAAPGLIAKGVGSIGKEAAKRRIAAEYELNLGTAGKTNLDTYTATPEAQQTYDLNLGSVTQDPYARAKEVELAGKSYIDESGKEVYPANTMAANKSANMDKLAGNMDTINVPNAKPEIVGQEAQTQVQAEKARIESPLTYAGKEVVKPVEVEQSPSVTKTNEALTEASKVSTLKAKSAVNKAYEDVAPTDEIKGPITNTTKAFDSVREENHAIIHGDEDNDIKPDMFLKEIDDRYSAESEDGISVKRQIADKNRLREYTDNMWQKFKDTKDPIFKQKAEIAQNMREGLVNNLSNMKDVPSAVAGKSVGEAFQSAEAGYKDFQQKYLTNPDTYSNLGKNLQSTSLLGKLFQRLQNRTEGAPGTEGAKLLDPSNPAEFKSSLKNIKNVEGADRLVKSHILSHINAASGKPLEAFDKIFTSDIEDGLRNSGMGKVADDLKTIRDNLAASKQTIESQNALLATGKAAAQADLDSSLASQLLNKDGLPLTQNQQVETILKTSEAKQNAVDLVNKANDNGASRRGLGQMLIDKLKNDSVVKDAVDIHGNSVKLVDSKKLNSLLTKHDDILSQVIDKSELDALKQVNEIARKIDYTDTTAGPSARQQAGPEQNLAGAGVIEGASKLGVIPSSSRLLLRVKQAFGRDTYYAALDKLQNPYTAKAYMDAVKAGKGQQFLNILTKTSKLLPAAVNAAVPANNSKQKTGQELQNSVPLTAPTGNKPELTPNGGNNEQINYNKPTGSSTGDSANESSTGSKKKLFQYKH